MSSTPYTFDPATPGTTSNVWIPRTWPYITTTNGTNYPLIAGGAEDANSDGDGTPPDTGDQGSADSQGTSEDKVFTQEQLNAIVTREVQKAARGKLDPKELGFDSGKDLKEFLDGVKAKAESEKDESEKALEAAVKQAQDAAREEILSKANTRVLKAEFLLAAKDAGVKAGAGNDAYVLAQTMDVWQDVAIGDDGEVTGFTPEFFKELKESKPFLFEAPVSGDIGAGAHGEGESSSDEDLLSKYPALQAPWFRS